MRCYNKNKKQVAASNTAHAVNKHAEVSALCQGTSVDIGSNEDEVRLNCEIVMDRDQTECIMVSLDKKGKADEMKGVQGKVGDHIV